MVAEDLCVSTLASLDGIIGNVPNWIGDLIDEEFQAESLRKLEPVDAMLMGRVSYEMFRVIFDGRTDTYARRINGIRKLVFSSTLPEAAWSNAQLVRGDAVAEIAELRRRDGGELMVYGYGRLAESLLAHGLVDELRVIVFPRFAGSGTPLFREGRMGAFKLLDVKRSPNRTVALTYQPENRHA